MSNFSFLNAWQAIHDNATQSESSVYADPRACCFYARRTLEKAVDWMYRYDVSLSSPYDTNLAALIHEPSFKNNLAGGLFPKLKAIQQTGNRAVHSDSVISPDEALQILKELHHFLYWFYRSYSEKMPLLDQVFNLELIPHTLKIDADLVQQSAKKLKQQAKQLAESDKSQAAIEAKNTALSEEIKTLQAKITAHKQSITHTVDSHNYNEADTRKFLIDLQLKEAGWDLTRENTLEYEVTGMPNNKGIGFVDYVLWGDDGLPLAVVEAKRTMHSATKGRQQAKLYTDCLEGMFKRRPLIYYSNGYELYFWDDTYYPERQVQGYGTQAELQRIINRRSERQDLLTAQINQDISGRYYQEEALRHICELFQEHKQRKALLVMATGSGKTRTIISLVDILLRHNWVKRVLFLADRNALVTQAKNEFNRLLPHSSPIILSSGLATIQNRVCFSTYPTMMNLLNEPAESRILGSGFFDLVVIDEAHRSVYKKYRSIFDYFDSLLVGLTATPKDDIDKNTYDVFGLESGVPTYAYEAEQAYADGFLVPPVCMSVPTKFMREGVHYKDLSRDEQEQWEDIAELDERTEVLPSEVNRFLFNEDTVDKALAHLMTHGIKVDGGDTLGKTIIFAANNKHANFIYARFNANYPKWAGHFARVITYKEDYAESLIADFKDNTPAKDPSKPNLTIAISVDMLDTGIDVPEVVNLVFFKVIKSKVKFLQMLGRGTRLCPMLFGMDQTNPEHNKQNFKVFDFCQNFEYFEMNPDGATDNKQKSLSQNIFEKRLQIATTLYKISEADQQQKETLTIFRDYTFDLLHHQVAGMNLDNFIVRPKRQYIEKLLSREAWSALNKSQISDIVTHVTTLPSDAGDFNDSEASAEDAKPFDHLVLQMQLTYLETNSLPQSLKLSIIDIAENLEMKASVPAVAEHLSFIQEIQTDAYWEYITLPMMEEIRIKLRCLIQFIDKGKKEIIYTDFEDELGASEVKDISIIYTPNSLMQYRKKIEAYIKTHEDQLTIQKLKRNKPITEQDLEVLEDILFQASGMESKEAYIEFYTDTKKLGVFVRELVGLDRAAAKEAFAGFLGSSAYNSTQIDFINRIIDYLTVNGVMDVGALYRAPFTDIHEASVDGFFKEAQVVSILDTLEVINGNSYFDDGVNFG